MGGIHGEKTTYHRIRWRLFRSHLGVAKERALANTNKTLQASGFGGQGGILSTNLTQNNNAYLNARQTNQNNFSNAMNEAYQSYLSSKENIESNYNSDLNDLAMQEAQREREDYYNQLQQQQNQSSASWDNLIGTLTLYAQNGNQDSIKRVLQNYGYLDSEGNPTALYDSLGVFISLIVVNCIILGRAESFASKNGPLASLMDAIGSGIGFTMAICIIAFFREIIGTGAITIGQYFPLGVKIVLQMIPSSYAISLFVQSAGGFLTLGLVLAFMAWRKNKKEDKKALEQKKKIAELKAQKEAMLKAKAQGEVKEAA